jgi:hypothetical protein
VTDAEIKSLIIETIKEKLSIKITTNTDWDRDCKFVHVSVEILLDGELVNCASDCFSVD